MAARTFTVKIAAPPKIPLNISSLDGCRPDLVLEVSQCLYRLHSMGKEVVFCWVPAHVGVKGNEVADGLAKRSVRSEQVLQVPYGTGEVKAIIQRKTMERWQDRWDGDRKGRAYHRVQKSVRVKRGRLSDSRRDEVKLAKLRFDHTGLNKTLSLIGKVQSDLCLVCQTVEDAEHVLMHCSRFAEEREQLRIALLKTRFVFVTGVL